MKLTLKSWGGFTGKAGQEIRRVDLDALPAAEAATLKDLLRQASVPSLAPSLLKRAPTSHDFKYELTVTDGDQQHVVTLHLDAAPPPLTALVRHLTETVEKEAS